MTFCYFYLPQTKLRGCNVFTGVCLSTDRQGWVFLVPGAFCRGGYVQGVHMAKRQVLTTTGWVCLLGDYSPTPNGTWDTTDTINKRVVCILLECFLVILCFTRLSETEDDFLASHGVVYRIMWVSSTLTLHGYRYFFYWILGMDICVFLEKNKQISFAMPFNK